MLSPSERRFGSVRNLFHVCMNRLFGQLSDRTERSVLSILQGECHQEIHLLPQSQAPSGAHVGWLVGDWTGLDFDLLGLDWVGLNWSGPGCAGKANPTCLDQLSLPGTIRFAKVNLAYEDQCSLPGSVQGVMGGPGRLQEPIQLARASCTCQGNPA